MSVSLKLHMCQSFRWKEIGDQKMYTFSMLVISNFGALFVLNAGKAGDLAT